MKSRKSISKSHKLHCTLGRRPTKAVIFGRCRVSGMWAVYQMLKQMKGIEVLAVYAPVGDKLYEYAEIFHNDVRASGTLRSFSMPQDADLIIATHSHDFISSKVRNRLRLGAIGYHPSLLPRHRGRDAVEWTLQMRYPVVCCTVFWLNDTVDGRPIARQNWCWVRPGDTPSELWRRELFPIGLRLIRIMLEDIMSGTIRMVNQDVELATWEPSFDGAPRLFRPELAQIGGGVGL